MYRRVFVLALLLIASLCQAQERIRDVIYMKQAGAAFTMDVFKPASPNGAAVIFLVSGGWFSTHEGINPEMAKGLNDLGYTVFEVVHGSQPKYTIPEIARMITRAVRFVHANAKSYGVDETRLALMGASAGGHLTLLTAARGDDGNAASTDPIEKASSRVKTAIAYFPPTDFLHYGSSGAEVSAKNPMMAPFIPAFGLPANATAEQTTALLTAVSPITYVTAKMPPTLLIHGDKDALVPIQQSETFRDKLKSLGVEVELVTVPGGQHDGATVNGGLVRLMSWLDEHLKK
jgi:acetyl esterase/lipase